MSSYSAMAILQAVTAEELELLAEQAGIVIGSFEHRGLPDRKQPTEWHEGKKLESLHTKITAALAEMGNS